MGRTQSERAFALLLGNAARCKIMDDKIQRRETLRDLVVKLRVTRDAGIDADKDLTKEEFLRRIQQNEKFVDSQHCDATDAERVFGDVLPKSRHWGEQVSAVHGGTIAVVSLAQREVLGLEGRASLPNAIGAPARVGPHGTIGSQTTAGMVDVLTHAEIFARKATSPKANDVSDHEVDSEADDEARQVDGLRRWPPRIVSAPVKDAETVTRVIKSISDAFASSSSKSVKEQLAVYLKACDSQLKSSDLSYSARLSFLELGLCLFDLPESVTGLSSILPILSFIRRRALHVAMAVAWKDEPAWNGLSVQLTRLAGAVSAK